MAEHHDELEADFQQFYGIDLETAFIHHSVRHIAVLALQLPYTSRTNRAKNPDFEWGLTETLLAAIFNTLRGIQYGMSGKKGGAKPKPIGPSAMTGNRGERKAKAMVMPIPELKKKLAWFDAKAAREGKEPNG